MTPLAPINILWTGGWDSSFRVLELVLRHRRAVRPLYLIDPARKSTAHELAAIEAITAALRLRDPETGKLLAPLEIAPVAPSTGPDDPWDCALRALPPHPPLGAQYPFIARTLARLDHPPVELCVERFSKVQIALTPHIRAAETDGLSTHALADTIAPDSPLRTLFDRCTFPLIQIGKMDMRETARAHGFADLIELTWFCHTPLPDARPCGCCTPCSAVLEDGLHWRIPRSSRLRRVWHVHARAHLPRAYRTAAWIGRRFR